MLLSTIFLWGEYDRNICSVRRLLEDCLETQTQTCTNTPAIPPQQQVVRGGGDDAALDLGGDDCALGRRHLSTTQATHKAER